MDEKVTKETLDSTKSKDTEEISNEQLMKELNAVAAEILEQKEEEKSKKLRTDPSAIALRTTEHSSGDNVPNIRKTIKQFFTLYLTNQFVSRAINVRADTIISRGYMIVGDDPEGEDACRELVENSGGTNLIWQLSVNTDIAGDGFLEKVYNQNKNKILKLKHVHPLTLTFTKDKQTDKIEVDSTTKEPKSYTQYYVDKNGVNKEKVVSKERIEHLRYNTLGDEFTGISTIQSGYDTIVRLMNMEFSAADAAVKTANPIIIGKCNTKSPNQVSQWASIIGKITEKGQVFIPEGMEFDMLSPGTQNFSDYSEYFLNAVVSTFGVPKSILLGSSGDSGSSRSEGVVLTRHFYTMISGLQKYVADYFNRIFEEYAELGGFKAPIMIFPDIAEDTNVNIDSVINLYNSGIITVDEARELIGLQILKRENPSLPKEEIADTVRRKDMETWHNNPGQRSGSQAGVKKAQKVDPNSLVSYGTK